MSVTSIQTSLAGLMRTQDMALACANRISRPQGDPTLAEDMVALLVAGDLFKANIQAIKIADEMSGHLVDLLG